MAASDFADVSGFFVDFGTPATWTPKLGPAVAGTVILDDGIDVVQFADVSEPVTAVTFATAPWAGIAENDRITIDGIRYRVRQFERLDDGAVTRAFLVKVGREVQGAR